MNKNKVDFQIKAYLLLYRNFKKLHTFKIQKVVRNLKKDGKRKLELESENSDPQKITKVQLEIERLEKQKAKLDRVTKEHLKMLTLHNLTTIYNFSLENYKTYFEKELPDFVAKIERFNNESEEDIQLIKWFEETIKDHKNYKETNEKLHFFSSQLEQIVEKNKVKRKTRLQNKKQKLKGKKGDGVEGDEENASDNEDENGIEKENGDEKVEAEGEGFDIEPQGEADGSESGEDIVLDDEDFEDEEDKPKRNSQKQQQPRNNNKDKNNRRDRSQNNRNSQGRDKAYMRIEDSLQRRELNKERNKSRKRGEEFDLNKFKEAQKAKEEKYNNNNREPLTREFQDGRRGGRDGGRGGSRGGSRGGRGDSRGGRGGSRGGRDNFEPDVRKKFQGSNPREERQDFRSQDKKNNFSFEQLHPSWKARIEQKQGATIATFQGTKEKL